MSIREESFEELIMGELITGNLTQEQFDYIMSLPEDKQPQELKSIVNQNGVLGIL